MAVSPKFGSAGAALVPVQPTPAVKAATDKTGKMAIGTSTPLPRQVVKVKPSVFKPKPTSKLAPTNPPPIKKSDKPCGIAAIEVTDPEKPKPRVPSPTGELHIVPRPLLNRTEKTTWFNLVEISSQTGGYDEVSIKIKSTDGKEINRKQACLIGGGFPPSESSWKNGAQQSFKLQAPASTDRWPHPAEPESYSLYGRGCDDCVQRVLIKVFPSQNYEVKIDINELKDLIDGIRGGITTFMQYFFLKPKSEMNQEERKEDKQAQKYEDGTGAQIEKNKGTLSVKWGWHENDDWRAFYGIEVEAGLDPLFSIAIQPKLSFAQIALTAHGVPPNVAKALADNIADVFLRLDLGFELKLVGTHRTKLFAAGDNERSGALSIEGTGKLGIVLGARVGSDWFVAIIATGQARTEVVVGGELEIKSDGLFLSPKVEVGGLIVELKVVLKAIRKERWKKSVEYQVFDPWTIYPTSESEPFKLLPRDNKSKNGQSC